jgi:hypothetical protein
MSAIETLLKQLVHELADDNTIALALTGAHIPGQPTTTYSDVDILRFVRILPPEDQRQHLRYVEETLVSITTGSIMAERKKLARPEMVVWTVLPLKQARPLYDPDGLFAALQSEAHHFRWNHDMQRQADAFASERLMRLARTAHLVMSALMRRDDAALIGAVETLSAGLMQVMTVQRGVLMRAVDAYARTLMRQVGLGSAWTYYLMQAVGLVENVPRMRGIAALGLYMKTVDLMRPILQLSHAQVVDQTWAIIAASGYNQDDQDNEG